MSLNWNAEHVADHKTLHADPVEWAITETLIFASMVVGLGRIATDADAVTFVQRLRLYCAATDNDFDTLHFSDGRADRRIEVSDVRRRIGLSTNVTRYTDAKFLSEVKRWIGEQHRAALKAIAAEPLKLAGAWRGDANGRND
jgi:hypothetical protein